MATHAAETDAVRRSVMVPLPVEEAFRLFTDGIDSWWPFDTHSIGGDNVETAVFEPRVGGRVYERDANGAERDWATITEWEPPARFALAWRVNPRATGTEVEVRFSPAGEETRIDLEHRGFAGRDEERSSYDTGWAHVLGRYSAGARA